MHYSVPLSRTVSGASLHESVQDDLTRRLASVDPGMQPRALGHRVPKSTRRDDYIYLMDTCRGMEQVVATHSRELPKAPIGAALNEYDRMPAATHFGKMLVHARTGTLYFFVQEVQAFMSSDGDSYLCYYAAEASESPQGAGSVATRTLFTLEPDLSAYPNEALRSWWFLGRTFLPMVHGTLARTFQGGAIPFQEMVNMHRVASTIRASQSVPGASVTVLSLSGTRVVEPSRSNSGTRMYSPSPLPKPPRVEGVEPQHTHDPHQARADGFDVCKPSYDASNLQEYIIVGGMRRDKWVLGFCCERVM